MKYIKKIKEHPWAYLTWVLLALFSGLYISLIFNINVTTDEIFTMKLIGKDLSGIIDGTAADVHPPLYYIYAKIFELVSPQNIHLQKLAVAVPMIGTLVLVATSLRKRFGEVASFWTILFFTCIPCTMEYAVQIRMYSLAILCVSVCALMAYQSVIENKVTDWIWLVIGAVGAAYLHYFAFVAICWIVGIQFLVIIVKKREIFIRWGIAVISMLVLYIPWMPYMYRQVTTVRGGYWIPPITPEVIWGYFTWAFDLELLPGYVYAYIVVLVCTAIYGIYRVIRYKARDDIYALLCMLIPTLTTLAGVIISLSKAPIFVGRYVIVAMMPLAIWWGITFAAIYKEKSSRNKKIVVTLLSIVVAVFLLFSGAVKYKECFRQEYRNGHTESTVAFFDKYLGENDYVVYNYKDMGFVFDYYFPEDKLVYVLDFDLSSDFDNVWFLSNLNEWDITDVKCSEHGLRKVYLGLYGVEGCDVDLYRITHE